MQELHDVCLFHKKCSLRSYLLEIFFYKIYTGTKFYELCTKICTLYARKKEKLEMKKIKMNISSIGMWIVLVTIVGLVAFSGCTDQEETDTEKTDTEKIEIEQKLVIAEPWGMSGVDPAKEGGTLNNFLVLDTLTVMEPDFNLVPGLAKSWELIDNTTWRVYLKDNIKFHDNMELTADDVIYSFERNIEINPTIKRDLGIQSIEKVDDYTVDMITEKPDAAIPAALSYAKAVIYSKNSVESDGVIIKPIGTGPFKFEKYDKAKDTLELSKYENHWNGAPKLDTVEVIKPFEGDIELIEKRLAECDPIGCHGCFNVCPAHAWFIPGDKKIDVAKDLCIYCGACEKACHVYAIDVGRTDVKHTQITNKPWTSQWEDAVISIKTENRVRPDINRRVEVDTTRIRHRELKEISSRENNEHLPEIRSRIDELILVLGDIKSRYKMEK